MSENKTNKNDNKYTQILFENGDADTAVCQVENWIQRSKLMRGNVVAVLAFKSSNFYSWKNLTNLRVENLEALIWFKYKNPNLRGIVINLKNK